VEELARLLAGDRATEPTRIQAREPPMAAANGGRETKKEPRRAAARRA